jgi:cell wall-associated NlpC family hydrolase
MLSFIISNAILVSQALTGMTPGTLESRELTNYQYSSNTQSLTVTSQASQKATRDDVTIDYTPVTQVAARSSQIVTQSLPLSNSSLANSAMKYVGTGWDCTRLVEQALRDIGYGIGDVGPMGFGSVGVVFSNPADVQSGDIMMRGGHVAIYIGDGLAVHGGYNGRVAIVSTSPSEFYSFVRL